MKTKIKVSLNGYTNKYFSSKLSAIKHARAISRDGMCSQFVSEFQVVDFKNGKIINKTMISSKADDFYYY